MILYALMDNPLINPVIDLEKLLAEHKTQVDMGSVGTAEPVPEQ